VPTGRPANDPTATLRPTNRPTAPRPRQHSAPGSVPRTEVLGGRPERARGTSVLPGTGAGPTTAVGNTRPRPPVARPGVPPHIRRRRARLAIALVLLLAVTIGAIGWWLGSGRWVDIPELVNQDKDTAIGMLQEAGLDPTFADEQFSETVPAGEVISADPPEGAAIRGSDVELVVSKGAERFTVDAALTGQPADDVQAELQVKYPQLVFQQAKETSEEIGAGNVIRFDPVAGTALKAGDTVTVVVSSGRAPVKVPDVVGSSPDAAQDTLRQLGFTVARDTGRSAEVATGQVMAVTPGPGDGAQAYGSRITITVSEGLPQVTVPDVVGSSEKDAAAALKAVGLKADSTSFIAGDRVFQQSPKAGEVVDLGSTVRILISFG
jgi:beta-lactam-binding protein with PASTA domain